MKHAEVSSMHAAGLVTVLLLAESQLDRISDAHASVTALLRRVRWA